ncbi:2-oxoglutarate dehydrogenase E1 component [Fontisphaera persica]|uniref:2-oxoglutarate dehydrogenase E1 component n=1 Tax=Fontisphaera persica TaxID=2974023 RepID=UPI0024BFB14C|nr:2-oxoglutarate dehydrogenase E1 component [Fontisphaera persica]WCJ58309.1 2-oxoglutarate dehydrogenase E1 component [Fontisphaera persica]
MSNMDEAGPAASWEFVEAMYADYLRDPASVPPEWQQYFQRMDGAAPSAPLPASRPAKAAVSPPSPAPVSAPPTGSARAKGGAGASTAPAPAPRAPGLQGEDLEHRVLMQHRVERLVRAYRGRGHIQARIDPLGTPTRYVPELDPQYYGFTEEDMDRQFYCETMRTEGPLTLRQIISRLRQIYCGSIAFQYLHIDDMRMRHWVQERIEGEQYWAPLPRNIQRRILTRLTDAVVFEQFVRRKFVGAKSFSLEGGESLIPLLDLAIGTAAQQGVKEIVLAMAHRGRLNVLANIIGKSPKEIFREFEDKDPDLYMGGGDVKYHMGYSSDYRTAAGQHVHLSLCFNPSHLEFVNPVALGRTRAKQDRLRDDERAQVMAMLIHGDAAFIGEGIVQETLNLSRLKGYQVGGTIHIILNNQIGFTTPPTEGRSTMYTTSVAKMLPAPIMHVNGEDPEAVARCIQLAMDFRKTFQVDVVIDMYCYRRLGHNEGDEPSFTQPLMYKLIEKKPSVRDAYLEKLIELGGVTRELAEQIEKKRTEALELQLSEARRSTRIMPPSSLMGRWKGYLGGPEPADDQPETGLPREQLSSLLERLTDLPEDFHLHPKLQRFMEARRAMAKGEQPLDWSAGEALALASLAVDGVRIRLSGQDSCRGTFSHRHAVLHDVENGNPYCPLQHLAGNQAPVDIINSPLSEAGVLGFEYGYSLDCPEGLIMWEAQFGDFVNVAQVIIDQFIASGEDKWRRLSGLVMLLPHGFEGAGPEHSSGRIERFLTLAADDNIQVAIPTTPAQMFHLLRRQALRRWRKPLVVFTPKSMLRHPRVVSSLDELASGRFQRVIPDPRHRAMDQVSRVLLCAGKLYYELEARREKLGVEDVAIVRLEQLYPFPRAELEALLGDCKPGTNVIWVQEEPENMGAWHYLRVTVSMQFLNRLPFSGICRPASASPATGSASAHQLEQEELLAKVFAAEQPVVRPRTETIIGTKQTQA